MFILKSSLLLIVLAVQYGGSNANAKDLSELEFTTNVNLAALYETVGADHDGEIQKPLFGDDTKCEGNAFCWNGGTCDSGTCKCLPGTSGPFCEKVEGCENPTEASRRCGNPDNVYCAYNVTSQKPYCRCANINFMYDPHYKICKECNCLWYGNCSFVNGKKTCSCLKDFGVVIENNVEDWCKSCDCGIYSEGCKYYGYKKTCYCKPGFSQSPYERCSECNCGPHGNCTLDYRNKICACEKGYVEKDGICQQCDCGDNGACLWNDNTGEKMCDCTEGYGIKNGICVECDCYMDNNRVNCTFMNGKKQCSCPNGYGENDNSTCVDINECTNKGACPPNSFCINTPGSYECTCETGFRPPKQPTNTTGSPNSDDEEPGPDPKVFGCEDINECLEPEICVENKTTTCTNTLGSYKCLCKDGYQIPPNKDSAERGCIKSEPGTSYTAVYVVLGLALLIIIIGCIVYFERAKLKRLHGI